MNQVNSFRAARIIGVTNYRGHQKSDCARRSFRAMSLKFTLETETVPAFEVIANLR